MNNPFMPGAELCRHYFQEIVRPILEDAFPDLLYDAAQLDAGSDTIGFDDECSMDHHWGLKVFLFVSPDDLPQVAGPIRSVLSERLPHRFRGHTTSYVPGQEANGVKVAQWSTDGPVHHWVDVWTMAEFCVQPWNLGVDPGTGLTDADWLRMPEHSLLRLTRGPVFHEGLGAVTTMRRMLRFYPDRPWITRMATLWEEIGQEEEFVSRCGDVGDDAGSRIIAARQAERAMRLCFLLERQYAPYSKWLGTAFRKLNCYPSVGPVIEAALTAGNWEQREDALCNMLSVVGEMHNDLKLTPRVDPSPRQYHTRPFKVVNAKPFACALNESREKL